MTKHLPDHTRRISGLVHRPGGMTAAEAVAAAEVNLESIRERGLSEIAVTIRAMHASADQTQCQALYRLSNGLVGVAGVFGKSGLGDVSHSLCTLIERLSAASRWDQAAIQLHLDSLHVLSQEGVSQAETATIAAALRQVVDRLQPARSSDRPNE